MPLDIWDDDDEYPPMPSKDVSALYRTEVIRLWAGNPTIPEQYYWRLYYKGEHINGGITDTEAHGFSYASMYRSQHQRQEFVRQYIWDAETYRWEPRMGSLTK